MAASLRYRHRVVSEADVAFIRQLIGEHPTASRRQLSKKLCQAWNWVQGNGTLRDMLCRGWMLQLHRAGWIELPPVRQIPRNPLAERSRPVLVPIEAMPVRCRLADIRPLEFHQVRRTPQEALCNSLLDHTITWATRNRLGKISGTWFTRRVARWLAWFGLRPSVTSPVATVSSGGRRRRGVAISVSSPITAVF